MSDDSRETLKNFLTNLWTGDADATPTMISYAPNTIADPVTGQQQRTGKELGNEPHLNTPLLNLGNTTDGLLGDWLKYLLDNAIDGNVYNLKGGNAKAPSPKRGVALEPAESTGAENVFVKSNDAGGVELIKYSNSGKFDNVSIEGVPEPRNLSDVTDKKMGVDGHYMYSDITGGELNKDGNIFTDNIDTSEKKIPTHTNTVLGTHNRFSANEKYSATKEVRDVDLDGDGELDAVYYAPSQGTEQEKFGAWDPATAEIKYNNIRKVGLSLLLKAAGMGTAVGEPGVNIDPDEFGNKLMSDPEFTSGFANSWSDPGGLLDFDNLRAMNAYGSPAHARNTNINSRLDLSSTGKTYGTTHTPWTKFDTLSPGPIIAQALASVKVLLELVETLDTDVVGKLQNLVDLYDGKLTIGKGPLWLGTSDHSFSGAYRLNKIKLTTHTDYAYTDCVTAGMDFIFGKGLKDKVGPSDLYASSPMMYGSPGYVLALARSLSRASAIAITALAEAGTLSFTKASNMKYLDAIRDSKVFGYMNSLAVVGNIVKKIDNISSESHMPPPWDVDMLADGPATRQAKSRSGSGVYAQSMAWRNSAVPSVFLLPNNLLYAANALGNQLEGASPFRGHMGSTLADKTYFGRKVGTGEVDDDQEVPGWLSSGASSTRIPDIVVRRMEDLLEAEYVPFYFHDIRTGEIIAFNAFITSLQDNFSAQNTPVQGYGRVDPIYQYKSTTRTVNFDFYIVATNPEDFDEMWFKINKLTTLVYPKYSPGTRVTAGGHHFTMPFSQIPTGTPVVRVRIGDVIKSNYSKFALGRMFGLGDMKTIMMDPIIGTPANPAAPVFSIAEATSNKVQAVAQQIFLTLFGSPLATIYDHGTDSGAMRLVGSALTAMLKNGFMNPIFEIYANMMRDPDAHGNPAPGVINLSSALDEVRSDTGGFGYVPVLTGGVLLKPSMERGYAFEGKKKGVRRMYTGAHYFCQVVGRHTVEDVLASVKDRNDLSGAILSDTLLKNMSRNSNGKTKTVYKVNVWDLNAPVGVLFETAYVTHADLCPSPGGFVGLMLALSDPLGSVFAVARWAINTVAQGLGIPGDEAQSVMHILLPSAAKFLNGNPASNFGNPNPITHAFESTRGRGLAGVLDGLKFTWWNENIPWSTDLWGRAPMIAKVSTGLKVIHDLPPGLGHGGYNRAPVYPVGKIMHEIVGDVYDDAGSAAAAEFKTARRKMMRKGES